jgi:3-deoxy-manno-octulosonate cytidylyltransferase (CMP-KDO synthetase)
MSTQPRFIGVIPARFESSRFPGKPLAEILGKPMFWHVYQRASQCSNISEVVLATDDQRIYDTAQALNVPVLMTADTHRCGTERVLEAAGRLKAEENSVIVNIQGDEPALKPQMLEELLAPFDDPGVQVATLAHEISYDEALSPDKVKVVVNLKNHALYFSRHAIPFTRQEQGDTTYFGHIGIFAFRMKTLKTFVELPASPLEQREKLEQLRLLENGIEIKVVQTGFSCHGVDRPEDIKIAEQMLREESC